MQPFFYLVRRCTVRIMLSLVCRWRHHPFSRTFLWLSRNRWGTRRGGFQENPRRSARIVWTFEGHRRKGSSRRDMEGYRGWVAQTGPVVDYDIASCSSSSSTISASGLGWELPKPHRKSLLAKPFFICYSLCVLLLFVLLIHTKRFFS